MQYDGHAPPAAPMPGYPAAPKPAPMPGYPGHPQAAPKPAPMPDHVVAPAPEQPVGCFAFTEDEFQAVIKQWRDLLHELKQAERAARPMSSVRPAADEPVSRFVATITNDSGRAYLKHNREAQRFVSEFLAKLTQAHQVYLDAEQNGTDGLRRAAGTPGGGKSC
ncbi:hypothetical protein GCM10010174_81670 [Kutzneria viridogrisea]|uniref:PE domain-containing protein n=2 Tax=Kutzneria TaxID=43356 RepID=W5WPE1_9PSEU|nr:PE family protein [Kutzneria albida]AHI00055.1 hypothetical protein KALB_6696 [Kutzneria albida DSM 43870]MBA8925234.1 hypothetical protein [Kutzneria viridogrisea]